MSMESEEEILLMVILVKSRKKRQTCVDGTTAYYSIYKVERIEKF